MWGEKNVYVYLTTSAGGDRRLGGCACVILDFAVPKWRGKRL